MVDNKYLFLLEFFKKMLLLFFLNVTDSLG